MRGQDDDLGTHSGPLPGTHDKASDEATPAGGGRTTEPVKLRLSPVVAAALRTGAESRRLTLSDYVSGLVLVDEIATANRERPAMLGLTEISVLAQAVHQLPQSCKDLRSELGRQGGLLKHLADQGKLADNSEQTAETLREILKTAQAVDAAVSQLLLATAETRADLERAARLVAGR